METSINLQLNPETLQPEENTQHENEAVRTPDKSAYMERINSLPAEDQAFLDGYLFAKVTEAAKKGA